MRKMYFSLLFILTLAGCVQDPSVYDLKIASLEVVDKTDSPLPANYFGEAQSSNKQLEIQITTQFDLADFLRLRDVDELYYEPGMCCGSLVNYTPRREEGREGARSYRSFDDRQHVPVYWSGIHVTRALEKNSDYAAMLKQRSERSITYQIYLPVWHKGQYSGLAKDEMLSASYDLIKHPESMGFDLCGVRKKSILERVINFDFKSVPDRCGRISYSGFIPAESIAKALEKAGYKVGPIWDRSSFSYEEILKAKQQQNAP